MTTDIGPRTQTTKQCLEREPGSMTAIEVKFWRQNAIIGHWLAFAGGLWVGIMLKAYGWLG